MTRRPADVPPDLWHGTMAAAMERLERNTGRLYCIAVPRDLRRKFLWVPQHFGVIGILLISPLKWIDAALTVWAQGHPR